MKASDAMVIAGVRHTTNLALLAIKDNETFDIVAAALFQERQTTDMVCPVEYDADFAPQVQA
jgi:hypothetical protein